MKNLVTSILIFVVPSLSLAEEVDWTEEVKQEVVTYQCHIENLGQSALGENRDRYNTEVSFLLQPSKNKELTLHNKRWVKFQVGLDFHGRVQLLIEERGAKKIELDQTLEGFSPIEIRPFQVQKERQDLPPVILRCD